MAAVKVHKWGWRNVVLRLAQGLKSRADTCRNITGRPEEEIEKNAKRCVYSTLAEDFRYLATMPPHEALQYLRDNYR